MSTRVLLIDDDARMFELLAQYLGQHGIAVTHAPDGGRGLAALEAGAFDAVLLDVMMPGLDGLEVCRRIRLRSHIPVLMLTARGDETDRVVGLELGADDYLPKPFRFAELVARLRALGRRRGEALPPLLRAHSVELDPGRRVASRSGSSLDLTPKEFAVLEALLVARGRVVSPEELAESVWDEELDPLSNTIRMTVMTLRRKLGEPPLIDTVRGSGYRL
jgi:DNA-binding response OmpR family regulator